MSGRAFVVACVLAVGLGVALVSTLVGRHDREVRVQREAAGLVEMVGQTRQALMTAQSRVVELETTVQRLTRIDAKALEADRAWQAAHFRALVATCRDAQP